MGLVQDSPVSTNMVSNSTDTKWSAITLAQKKNSKSKILILTISGQMSLKPAIVYRVI